MYNQTEKVNHGCHQTGRLRTFFSDANKTCEGYTKPMCHGIKGKCKAV